MKKILIIIQEVFKNDKTFKHKQEINILMYTIFKEKKTSDSILLFEDLKKKFEQEIAKRGIDGFIENTTCEEYFNKNKKSNHC